MYVITKYAIITQIVAKILVSHFETTLCTNVKTATPATPIIPRRNKQKSHDVIIPNNSIKHPFYFFVGLTTVLN